MGDVVDFNKFKKKTKKKKNDKVEKALDIVASEPENEEYTESLAILMGIVLDDEENEEE